MEVDVRCGFTIGVGDASAVGEVRRRLSTLAQEMGFGETDAGRVAVVATEMAGNLAKHARGGGQILAQTRIRDERPGIEILALDRGPGIASLPQALRDGYSTAGSPGTGLGAMSRMADDFDIHSVAGVGTAVLARLWPQSYGRPTVPPLEVGAVRIPHPGETACGDAWAWHPRPQGGLVVVADGLGHGPGAAEASSEAVRVFREHPDLAPTEMLRRMHDALRPTRGAAVAVVELDVERGEIRFAGTGNISGAVVTPATSQSMVSHSGIVGHQMPRAQEFVYSWPEGALVILHSDGIGTRWTLERYPGLISRDASLVAGVLYRDYSRENDDATVVAARRPLRP
ncbi:MAG: SpoIIE family protein phosphatase [Gemmatimonadetes bacterium]|nr:SpoIIE family protein phosphatase [Gemmatimonadota bacterium]